MNHAKAKHENSYIEENYILSNDEIINITLSQKQFPRGKLNVTSKQTTTVAQRNT